MADIFISYSSANRQRIQKLASALELAGFTVWWDRELVGGQDFSKEIEKEINESQTVIVAWSEDSVASHWVRDEASLARSQEKLLPIRLDQTNPPLGFQQVHTIDFSDWQGATETDAFLKLTDSLRQQHHTGTNRQADAAAAAVRSKGEANSTGTMKRGVIIAVTVILAIIAWIWMESSKDAVDTSSAGLEPPVELDQEATPGKNSIAVLAFENVSADAEQEYFSKGVSEEILIALSKLDNLRVAGRTSSFALSNDERDTRIIGDLLDVEHILDGSVRTDGRRVRITAQLVRTDNGEELWSETFDRQLTDIFAIQEEIAQVVVSNLEITLGTVESGNLVFATDARPDIDIYRDYLRAVDRYRDFRQVFGDDGAIALLESVVAAAPDFTPARAHLAGAYMHGAGMQRYANDMDSAQMLTESAVNAARATLAMNPDNSLSLATLGAAAWITADMVSARRYYEQAVQAKSADDTAPIFFARLLHSMGDNAGAKEIVLRALEENPTSPNLFRTMATLSMESGEYQDAENYGRLAYEYGLDFGLHQQAIASRFLGDYERANRIREQFNASPGSARHGKLDRLTLDPIYFEDAKQEFIDLASDSSEIFLTPMLRYLDENELADEVLARASTPGELLDRWAVGLGLVWMEGGEEFRGSPAFDRLVDRWNMLDYWQTFGFPPQCKPFDSSGQGREYRCD